MSSMMLFHKIFLSYQPRDDSDIRELEKMGIRFVPKVLKNGVIEDTYDRDRRANREKKQEKLDIEMIGLVKKKKKKIKPGYKKKIKWAVDEKRRKAKRAENRARGRAERKAKLSNPFFHMFRRKHRFSLGTP